MSMIKDQTTGFPIADPNKNVFTGEVSSVEIESAFREMILSASGWRKIFSIGGEESADPTVNNPDKMLAAAAGIVVARFFAAQAGDKRTVLAVGTDTRPTGPVIADVVVRTLLQANVEIRYLFITAAPEIMAYVKQCSDIDGFVYISASHNPIGHNGFKIGLGDGAVVGGEGSAELIQNFLKQCALLSSATERARLAKHIDGVDVDALGSIFTQSRKWKSEALKAYRNFSYTVLADSTDTNLIEQLTSSLSNSGTVGIIAELNGSARTLSIDIEYLKSVGAIVETINGKPREIAHRIVPEGASLEQCQTALESAYKTDPRFVLGYVPDNDGDRGNIVYMDEHTGNAKILHAQQVFALVVLAELAFAEYSGKDLKTWVVVVNGPTSMIVDKICNTFGVPVVRAEVGEANVVGAARILRQKGHVVRVMGEGSNGGNITYPAEVRDPLNTLGSLLKLLILQSDDGPFARWCTASEKSEKFVPNFGMANIVSTLPRYTTTSAYEDRGIMTIKSTDHALLKGHYEDIFKSQWVLRAERLQAMARIENYREVNYEGTCAIEGMGSSNRSGAQKGGLKMEFIDNQGEVVAYIWMRGSGTEPVFRVLADTEGTDPQLEKYLLDWQREMIVEADRKSIG